MALRSLQMTIRRCLELQLRFLNVMQSRIRQNFNVQWLHCSWHSTLSLLARELQTAYAPAGVLFRDWCRNSSRPSVLTSREMWMAIPKRIKALIQWGSIATVRRNPILLVVWETVRHPDLLVLFSCSVFDRSSGFQALKLLEKMWHQNFFSTHTRLAMKKPLRCRWQA